MIRRFLILVQLIGTAVIAQDTVEFVPYHGGMDLKDGIYLDFNAFGSNRPSIPNEKLRNSEGMAIPDIRQVEGKIFWQPDTGERRSIRMVDVWGFCQNDAVYVSAGNGFYRIGLLGMLSHMIYEQTYRDLDPYPYSRGTIDRTFVSQQMIDMNTGEFLPFNAAGMDRALQHDPMLLEEFRAMRKKERNSDEVLFKFFRLYNDRHPLEFPK